MSASGGSTSASGGEFAQGGGAMSASGGAMSASGGEFAQGGETESATCILLHRVELSDEFSTAYDTGVARQGDEFTFLRAHGSAYEFATASWSGLGPLTPIATSADVALGGAVVEREQGHKTLLVIDRGSHGPRASSWQPGQSAPLAQTDLFSATFSALTTRASVATSWDGRRLWLAYGNIVHDEPIQVMALDADLQALTAPASIAPGSELFDSLALVNTARGAVVSFTTKATQTPVWHVTELDADGSVSFTSAAPIANPSSLGPQSPFPTLANSSEFFALWRQNADSAVLTRMAKNNGSAPVSTQSFAPGFWLNATLLAPFEQELIVSRWHAMNTLEIQRFDFQGNALSEPLVLPGAAGSNARLLSIDGQKLTFAYRSSTTLVLAEISCP